MYHSDRLCFCIGLFSGILAFISQRNATTLCNSASVYETESQQVGRTLLASNLGAKEWTLLYDSNDSDPIDNPTLEIKEDIILGRDAGDIKQLLTDEVTTTRFLHVGVLCSGRNERMTDAIKHTWGSNAHTLYYHASDHFHIFNRSPRDTVVASGPQIQLPVLSLDHICDHLLDDYKWHMLVDDHSYVKVEELEQYLQKYSSDREHLFGSWAACDDHRYCIKGAQGLIMSRRLLKTVCPFVDPKQSTERENQSWSQRVVDSLKIEKVHVQPLNEMAMFSSYEDIFPSPEMHPNRETMKSFQNVLLLSGIPSAAAMTSSHVATIRQRIKSAKESLSVFHNYFKDLIFTVNQQNVVVGAQVMQAYEKAFSQQTKSENPCTTPMVPTPWIEKFADVTFNVRSAGICLTDDAAPVLRLDLQVTHSQMETVYVHVASVIQDVDIVPR